MKQYRFALLATLSLSFFLSVVLPAASGSSAPAVEAPGPRYPLTVVKVKGRVRHKSKILRVDHRITNIAQVRFDSTNNIVKVKDATGQGYFIVPKDYNLNAGKACTAAACKPEFQEKMSLPGGF